MLLRKALFGLGCSALLVACQGFPFWKAAAQPVPPEPSARVRLEFQNAEHDGTYLTGRFLVGVEEGRVRLDKRLFENVSVTVESVWTCDTHEEVPVIFADYVIKARTAEHLIVLERGYWYGADLRFLLLDEEYTGKQGPPCIEVEFSLGSFDGHLLTRANLRAYRKVEISSETSTSIDSSK